VWTIPSTLLRTGKDVLGHIASWEETCLKPLRHYADGGPFEVQVIEDYPAWNDEQAARKRDIPLEAILDELATHRAWGGSEYLVCEAAEEEKHNRQFSRDTRRFVVFRKTLHR
jgi:hypothetical protein